ncbi:MAG: hypothetical protein LBI14_00265 [Treponema sp.]|jgi:hypothetical protein|nr:hypothetical protein [Treponema sp.]
MYQQRAAGAGMRDRKNILEFPGVGDLGSVARFYRVFYARSPSGGFILTQLNAFTLFY